MKKLLMFVLLCAVPFAVSAREDDLAGILRKFVEREQLSPDSVEYDISLLEEKRLATDGVRRALYDVCLAKMYHQNQYNGVRDKWRARTAELLREAFSDPEALYTARTRDWLPVVKRGSDEAVYNSSMLYVIWLAARECMPDSVYMSEDSLISFCAARGNVKPQRIARELKRLEQLNDSINKIEPQLYVRMAQIYYPGDSLRLEIGRKNICDMTFGIYDTRGRLVSRDTLFAPSAPGLYVMKVRGTTKTRLRKRTKALEVKFTVSRLQMLVQEMPDKQIRVIAVDAKSGVRIPDAQVILDEKKRTARVVLGADSLLPAINYYRSYSYSTPPDKYSTITEIFTDRKIYRPGQEVKAAAVVYERRHWDARVVAGQRVSASLTDGENKVLDSKWAETDSMGNVAVTFNIPQETRLGNHMVKINNSVETIRVEEYKRPEFYVTLEADTLVVTGRAMKYNGTPLREGRVTGTVRRQACWWWRRSSKNNVPLDTTYTDAEGRFTIRIPRQDNSGEFRYFPTMLVSVRVVSPSGEEQTASASVRLFPDPPQETQATAKKWLEVPVDTFETDVPAVLEFRGKAGRMRHMYLMGFTGNRMVIDTVVSTSDTLCTLQIPYLAEYGDGLRLSASCVLDGIVEHREIKLWRRMPEKRLSLHWDTFRDHTQPGELQQWTLRVSHLNGSTERASVLMSVYDASLDALAPNSFGMQNVLSHYIPYARMRYGFGFQPRGQMYFQHFEVKYYTYPQYSFTSLDESLFNSRYVRLYYTSAPLKNMTLREVAVKNVRIRGNASAKSMDDALARPVAGLQTEGALADEGGAQSLDGVAMRSDFSETATFQSGLMTDGEGRVSLSFRLPQSLTTWHILGFAHTSDMCYGKLDSKLVAQKSLMAELHLPRFVREGDDFSFSSTIDNTTDKTQQVRVEIVVRDAVSQKVVCRRNVRVSLGAQRDSTITTSLYAPQGAKGLLVSIKAATATDSDGEMREIPVLESVADLVSTKAITLEPGETVSVDFQDLFPAGAVNRTVVVEQNLDPIQSAINALPQILEPKCQDVLSYASAYYAASRLGNKAASRYINKVRQMQNADGSISWFPGLNGNNYMTCEVGFLLARLATGDADASGVLYGIRKYLKGVLQKSLDERNKSSREWHLSWYDLRALYVLTASGTIDNETGKLVRRMLKHAPTDVQEVNNENLALLVIVQHNMQEKLTKGAMEMIHKRLEHKDGTYMAYRSADWNSLDRRIAIHTQVMEAICKVTPQDSTTIRGMQKWLLKQKRTQVWDTPVNSIDAVYALTLGVRELTADGPSSIVHRPSFMKVDTIDVIRRRNVVLSNKSSHETWASVYASYSLPYDKVEGSGTGFEVAAQVDREDAKVGDRIRHRVTVTAGNDYDYVVVTVPRSASVEPVSRLSGCGYQGGIRYYRQVYDDRTEYFIPSMPHGVYVLDEEQSVQRVGKYNLAVPTVQCQYAPEYRAHGNNSRHSVVK
ncbi:MAG: hypothetical protein J5630_06210 [Bacteroidaceae bacterium]|nr:hypothetical protein [Bacteroidaceae bacterium]